LEDRIQPIPIPKGVEHENIKIMDIACLGSIVPLLKLIPNVKEAAHL
jgi:hypothetical protein